MTAAKFAPALERAAGFVAAHGSPLDAARLAALRELAPSAEARAALEALQAEDGGFAALPGRTPAGPVRAVLEALWAMQALRVRHAPALERASDWLAARQAEDGGWREAGADPVSLTGLVAGALARGVYARPAVIDAAGDFLAAGWAPEVVEGGDWDRVAAHCAYFSNVPHELADEVLQWCGRSLEKGWRGGAFDAVATSRVLTLCDAVAMPGARIDPGELVLSVLGEQADDGGWPGADRVASTLDAALALVRLPS